MQITSPLDEKMGLEILEVSPQKATCRYPIATNTQPNGLWHGGASCVAAETIASLAALSEVAPDGQAYGAEINVSHLQPARTGYVNVSAEAVKIGKTLATYQVSLRDDERELIATGRVTIRLRRN